MAEVLHDYGLVKSTGGPVYHARACGAPMDESRWQGWLEFEPVDGGDTLRSGRETTQPNRVDTAYWATGLTTVYLEGALDRVLKPLVRPVAPVVPLSAFDGPAPPRSAAPAAPHSVLNPFSVYRKGEALLRDQLHALSDWHLVNIIRDYELSSLTKEALDLMPSEQLIEVIVSSVRAASEVNQ